MWSLYLLESGLGLLFGSATGVHECGLSLVDEIEYGLLCVDVVLRPRSIFWRDHGKGSCALGTVRADVISEVHGHDRGLIEVGLPE